ncbi:MAG: hypothetical protein C4309_11990, partial [Chloroflexota bacterium]
PPATPTPTPVPPTETPTPLPPSPTPTASPTPQPTPESTGGSAGPVSLGSLLVVLVGLGLVGAGSFWWGRNGGTSLVGAVRLLLLSWLGGLIGYNYFALGLPGAEVLAETWGAWSAVALAWGGAVAALGGYMLLTRLRVRTSNGRERMRG